MTTLEKTIVDKFQFNEGAGLRIKNITDFNELDFILWFFKDRQLTARGGDIERYCKAKGLTLKPKADSKKYNETKHD